MVRSVLSYKSEVLAIVRENNRIEACEISSSNYTLR
jgi:hypothetical protein